MSSGGWGAGVPGFTAQVSTTEADILWGGPPYIQNLFDSGYIVSTAVDAGNTPTTLLRAGLVLGKNASGQYTAYVASNTDGSQQAVGILLEEINMLDPVTAAVASRVWRICVSGPVKAGRLIGLNYLARAHLQAAGFVFDDDYYSNHPWGWRRVVQKAADYTVTAADQNTLFSVTGTGANFTLPTIAPGLRFLFLNTSDTTLEVTSAEGTNMVADGNAGASHVSFSTSSHKIGSMVEVVADYVGGSATLLWVCMNRGGTVATPT